MLVAIRERDLRRKRIAEKLAVLSVSVEMPQLDCRAMLGVGVVRSLTAMNSHPCLEHAAPSLCRCAAAACPSLREVA